MPSGGEPGGVPEALAHVLGFELRVLGDDLVCRLPGREVAQHERNRNPDPADTRLAATHPRIDGDAPQRVHGSSLLCLRLLLVAHGERRCDVAGKILRRSAGDLWEGPATTAHSRPPVDEQREVVRRLDALFALGDAIDKRLEIGTRLTGNFPQAILSKAFRGELVPTEADLARAEGRTFESAEELLARAAATRSAEGSAGKCRERKGSKSSEGRRVRIQRSIATTEPG